jgi:hypothetical protein
MTATEQAPLTDEQLLRSIESVERPFTVLNGVDWMKMRDHYGSEFRIYVGWRRELRERAKGRRA